MSNEEFFREGENIDLVNENKRDKKGLDYARKLHKIFSASINDDGFGGVTESLSLPERVEKYTIIKKLLENYGYKFDNCWRGSRKHGLYGSLEDAKYLSIVKEYSATDILDAEDAQNLNDQVDEEYEKFGYPDRSSGILSPEDTKKYIDQIPSEERELLKEVCQLDSAVMCLYGTGALTIDFKPSFDIFTEDWKNPEIANLCNFDDRNYVFMP